MNWRTEIFRERSRSVIAMLRVRNEALILQDTLDHISSLGMCVVSLDDNSSDASAKILREHPSVMALITGPDSAVPRPIAETNHRQFLLELASSFQPEWVFCCDADERFELPAGIMYSCDGFRVSLFDAYLTPGAMPYAGGVLEDAGRLYGPERRDILMGWKVGRFRFEGIAQREPIIPAGVRISTEGRCRHYGKALTEAAWNQKCDFYATHFPWETYGKKWSARRGKCIRSEHSDFGRPLYPWGDQLFANSIRIHP